MVRQISARRFTTGGGRVVALAALLCTSSAHAAGFYISEVGTPASLGTAGAANVTNTWGPDSTWANPAGLVHVEGDPMVGGLQAIVPYMKWDTDLAEKGGDDGGNAGVIALVPSFYLSRALADRWTFGFGLSALQGGGADYGDGFAGRYGTIDVALAGLGGTFSLGYKVNDALSLGLGASVIRTTYEQKIAINLGPLPDGTVRIKNADDTGVQPILGLQYAFTDKLLFGVTYRAEYDTDLKGNVRFRGLPAGLPLPSQTSVKLKWKNPQWLEAGLSYRVDDRHMLFVSGNWQEWSEFSQNTLVVDTAAGNRLTTLERDWDDTWRLAVGYGNVDYYQGWTLGVSYESSPAKDSVRTIDFPVDSSWKLSSAYGRRLASGRALSVGATLQIVGDAEIDQTNQGIRFAGEFSDFYVLYAGMTLRF
ncbi:MAG: outer membrane protein transport protein [Gammaproteobacteria bacterium]